MTTRPARSVAAKNYSSSPTGGSVVSQATTDRLLQPLLQAQDGSFYGTDSDGMIKFDQSGNIQWSVPGDSPQIATADDGVIGASGTTYDSSGNATGQLGNANSAAMTSIGAASRAYRAVQAANENCPGGSCPIADLVSLAQSWISDWYQIATGSVNQLLIPPIAPATPPWASFVGLNQSADSVSPPCLDDRDQLTPGAPLIRVLCE